MKGKSKYIVPLLLAGGTASAGVATTIEQQQQTVVQAAVKTPDTLNSMAGSTMSLVGGFEDSYKLGDTVTMPDVTVDAGHTVTYKI